MGALSSACEKDCFHFSSDESSSGCGRFRIGGRGSRSATERSAAAKLGPVTVEKWERRSEVPLILLALAFLVAYAWPVLDPRLDPSTRTVLDALSWTVWGAFAVDLLIR